MIVKAIAFANENVGQLQGQANTLYSACLEAGIVSHII